MFELTFFPPHFSFSSFKMERKKIKRLNQINLTGKKKKQTSFVRQTLPSNLIQDVSLQTLVGEAVKHKTQGTELWKDVMLE